MRSVAEVNRRYYECPGVVEFYRDQTQLCPAETLVLESLRKEIKDLPLLEVGVGAGRLTPYLTAITKNYVGIDCSQPMIDVARRKFNEVQFLACSAENMPLFEDQQFAAVVFCGNGIDEVENQRRIQILREINRVLRKGGIFFLSSHNFNWARLVNSAAFDAFSVKRGAVHVIASLPHRLWIYLSCLLIQFTTRLSQRGYAIFPLYEDRPRITMLIYHISKEAQIEQLINTGFWQVKAFSSGGVELNDKQPNGRLDYEAYYVSRKY